MKIMVNRQIRYFCMNGFILKEVIIDNPANPDDNRAEALHTYNRKYFGLE